MPVELAGLSRLPLREQIYAALLAEIVAGRLEPGRRIRDLELAQRLRVSRTPVREALQRLQDEGLVETSPGASTRVAPMDGKSAEQAFPVAAVLHALGTRLGVPHLAPRHLAALRWSNERLAEAIAEGDAVEAIAADDAFHGVFLEAADNAELTTALARLMPKLRRLEHLQFGSTAGRRSVAQHREIIAAATRADAQRAAALVEANWLSLGQLLARSLR